jgi:hypothetical protein
MEPWPVATSAMDVRRSNRSARSHPPTRLYFIRTWLYRSHPPTRLYLIRTLLYVIRTRLDLIRTRLDLINSRLDLIHDSARSQPTLG